MKLSHNGWPIIQSSRVGLWQLPAVTGHVKAGPVWVVFLWLSLEYSRLVEPIDRAQSWGWAFRKIVGGSPQYSNHASGTAVDFNAVKHPFLTSASQNMTADQIKACRQILDDAGGVLRWLDRHDPMHWEIAPKVTPAQVEAFANRLLQAALGVKVDGVRGPETTGALRAFQESNGLTVDGIDGPATWQALVSLPPTPAPTHAPARRLLKVTTPLMRGDDVKALQEFALKHFPGYARDHLGRDHAFGLYGDGTAAFVGEFQTRTGLKPDRVVGPATWAKLDQHGFK